MCIRDRSGGGVTLGGGEVTSQPEAAINLLQACKQEGLHTAIETCGSVSYTHLSSLRSLSSKSISLPFGICM